MCSKRRLLIISLLWVQIAVHAQRGVLLGTVWDSAHNYQLPSASIVVFNADSVMQQYTLSDHLGSFSLSKLPLDQKLYVIVSYTGYKTIKKDFIIRSPDTVFNCNRMNLHRSDNDQLEEVVVKAIIPVRMNGDTLEFNADAFTLEKGAVVEDLLRKLPGITLWGDGAITVNGRKVSSVKVDGKPFFGGDPEIATQNLDKMAVEKIQVYQEENLSDPTDSILHLDIKLKADKKTGYFGKMAAGAGSGASYEGDLSINSFSPKVQAGLAGNLNNVNKKASDINTLLTNSTFKGSGTQTNYLSNFNLSGQNRTRALGYTLQYDFLPEIQARKSKLFKSDYFFTNDRNETDRHTLTLITFRPDSLLARNNSNTTLSIDDNHQFRSDYTSAKDQSGFFTNADFQHHRARFRNNDTGAVANAQQELVSTTGSVGEGVSDKRSLQFVLGMDHKVEEPMKRFQGIRVSYTLGYDHNGSDRSERTAFNSFVNPAENRLFNRRYDNSSKQVGNTVDLDLPNLGTLLLGRRFGMRSGLQMGLSTKLDHQRESVNDQVQDLDFGNNHYTINNFLTNKRHYDILEATPSLNLARQIEKQSSNRYHKQAMFRVELPLYARYDESKSDKQIQNFTRRYHYFLPNASISYHHSKFGFWTQDISLRFDNSLDYPSLQQLAPLTDSANMYSLQFGNLHLKASILQQLSASYRFSSGKRSRDLSAGLQLTAGRIIDNIVDSSFYDASGRNLIYFMNTPLSTILLNVQGNMNSSFKIGSNQIQVQLLSTNRHSRRPNYINGLPNLSEIFNSHNSLSFYYNLQSLISFKLAQSVAYQRVNQSTSQHTKLSSVTAVSQASVAVDLLKNWHLFSNLFYTYNKYGTSDAVRFNIWNTAIAYRFLPGKNAEVKLSALDLLRQNKSIVNHISTTSLTTITSNVLQQYFMLTFSFYPRKFGKFETANPDN